jgi:hypothetical protein
VDVFDKPSSDVPNGFRRRAGNVDGEVVQKSFGGGLPSLYPQRA